MVTVGMNKVYLQGERIVNTKTNKQEWLIVSTYHQPGESIKRYGQRWYIENMFKDMKSNGFQLKCTHITDPERLSTLMSILAIAYTWMISIGTWVKKIKPEIFKKKKHGRYAWVYAYWGINPSSTRWVKDTYRSRFGIETSYRQLNEARIKTCTRNPLVRFFFIALALILPITLPR